MRYSTPFITLSLAASTLALKHKHWLQDFRNSVGEIDLTNTSPVQYFTQTLDHFPDEELYAPHPPPKTTFTQRWWYNIAHYKEGGPVIFQDPGEGPGSADDVSESYMPGQLAEQLGGIAVALEHRYFGASYPVANQTTDAMRFLSVRQAMADCAFFAQTVEIPELKQKGINITKLDWIVYGGSYPGAKAAFQRVTYPDLFIGGIASSAVTHPVTDFWQYFDVARRYLPPVCSAYLVSATSAIDRLLALDNSAVTTQLEKLFSSGKQNDLNFAFFLEGAVAEWQGAAQEGVYDGSWNPAKNQYGTALNDMCSRLSNVSNAKAAASLNPTLLAALKKIVAKPDPTVVEQFKAAGITYSTSSKFISGVLSSFVEYSGSPSSVSEATEKAEKEQVVEEIEQAQKSLSGDDSLSWEWLVCNEFGFQQDAASTDTPSIVSRYITYPALYKAHCTASFPPGHYYKLPNPVNTSSITAFGNFDIKIDNLIMVGGEYDPWRPATPLVDGNKVQNSTNSPAYLIPNAGHCFDFAQPSANTIWKAPLNAVLDLYVSTVKGWLSDAKNKRQHSRTRRGRTHPF